MSTIGLGWGLAPLKRTTPVIVPPFLASMPPMFSGRGLGASSADANKGTRSTTMSVQNDFISVHFLSSGTVLAPRGPLPAAPTFHREPFSLWNGFPVPYWLGQFTTYRFPASSSPPLLMLMLVFSSSCICHFPLSS